MPLEPSFDNIDDLNPLWPDIDDEVSEGAAHIAGIKNAIQGNITGDAASVQLWGSSGRRVLHSSSTGATVSSSADGTVTLHGARANLELMWQIFSGTSTAGFEAISDDIVELNVQHSGVMRQRWLANDIILYPQGQHAGTDAELSISSSVLRYTRDGALGPNLLLANSDGDVGGIVANPNSHITITHNSDEGILLRNLGGAANLYEATSTVHRWHLAGDPVLQMSNLINPGITLSAPTSAGEANLYLGNSLGTALRLRTHVNNTLGSIYFETAQIRMQFSENGSLMFNGSGVGSLRAFDELGGSRAEITDELNVWRPVGFNTMPPFSIGGNITLTSERNGFMNTNNSANNYTVTLPTGESGAQAMLAVISQTGQLTVTAGTLQWLTGAGVQTGTRTIAGGGVATVWHSGSGIWYIWGEGIS